MHYAADPDWFYDLPQGKANAVLGYLMARKERGAGLWSASPLSAVDLVHLLAQVLGKGSGQEGADAIESMLSGLWSDPPVAGS